MYKHLQYRGLFAQKRVQKGKKRGKKGGKIGFVKKPDLSKMKKSMYCTVRSDTKIVKTVDKAYGNDKQTGS